MEAMCTNVASSHGIAIVLHFQEAHTPPERRGRDHGGGGTLVSESVVGIRPHFGQHPGYPQRTASKATMRPQSQTLRASTAPGARVAHLQAGALR